MPLLRLMEITDQTFIVPSRKARSSVRGAEKRDLDVINKLDTFNQYKDTSCFQLTNEN